MTGQGPRAADLPGMPLSVDHRERMDRPIVAGGDREARRRVHASGEQNHAPRGPAHHMPPTATTARKVNATLEAIPRKLVDPFVR